MAWCKLGTVWGFQVPRYLFGLAVHRYLELWTLGPGHTLRNTTRALPIPFGSAVELHELSHHGRISFWPKGWLRIPIRDHTEVKPPGQSVRVSMSSTRTRLWGWLSNLHMSFYTSSQSPRTPSLLSKPVQCGGIRHSPPIRWCQKQVATISPSVLRHGEAAHTAASKDQRSALPPQDGTGTSLSISTLLMGCMGRIRAQ